MRACGAIVFIVVFALAFAGAQTQNRSADIKFRLGQSYERAGNLEAAATVYGEAYGKDSVNPVIADALRRVLLQLKRYNEVVVLLESGLRRSPSDIGLLAQLGSVEVLMGKEALALETWEHAIAVDPDREATYRVVGSAIVQSRLFEQAIACYKRGRTTLGSPALFASDIGYLYSITMNYGEATREFLRLLRSAPGQLSYIQTRIASYTGRTDGLSAAVAVVEDSAKIDLENLPFQQLLAWLYMEGKYFDRAYGVSKAIDAKMNAGGRELYVFAERALREKAYTVAARAYLDILTDHPKFDKTGLVKFGYALTLEESDAELDSLGPVLAENASHPAPSLPRLYGGALSAYARVLAEHPGSEVAARALLRTATIKHERYFDLDGAQAAVDEILKNYPRIPGVTAEARLRLGDILTARGDLAGATECYRQISETAMSFPTLQERASLRLAETDYFQQRFPSALDRLKSLSQNASSDITNDALRLQLFLEENSKTGDAALRKFSEAELLERQHRLAEALSAFRAMVSAFPGSEILDEVLLKIGQVSSALGHPSEAAASYEKLLTDFPESIQLDRALISLGRVYQTSLKDPARALEAYQRLLEKFPGSLFSAEARRRIREMRGDAL